MTTAYVTHTRYSEHNLTGHPEHAGRIRAVWGTLDDLGLVERLKRIEPNPVDEALVRAVHSDEFIRLLNWTVETRRVHFQFDADTYGGPDVYELARLSAGGVVMAVDEVLSGYADNALAAVRPPGHHAMPGHAMGFCIVGNIAIAARHAQRAYGLKRVLIVDFDVHHGNGTEAMFYDDDSVLFISTHQAPYYPGTGKLIDTGVGRGEGYTLNIPLPPGHGDTSYAALFEQVVWPAARRFAPELILVSAGFDAHWQDPLAQMRLSLDGYAHLSRELVQMAKELCGGKIVFVLEGGYHLQALGHGMGNVAYALMGDATVSDPLGKPKDKRAEPDVLPLIGQLKGLHRL